MPGFCRNTKEWVNKILVLLFVFRQNPGILNCSLLDISDTRKLVYKDVLNA
jgi:hypothetical protein